MKIHVASDTVSFASLVRKETIMSHTKALLAVFPLAALAAIGCTPPEQGSIFIEGARQLVPPCTVSTGNTFQSQSLLDIGTTPETANDLLVPLQVVTNLPATFSTQDVGQDGTRSPNYPNYGATDNNVVTFSEAEAFLTTDADRGSEAALTEEGLPTSDSNARVTAIGGTVFNTQTQLSQKQIVFVTAITTEDAALLQQDPFVADAINGDPTKTVKVTVNLRINGNTTGNATVRSAPFPYQVELCQGCLFQAVTDCDPETAGDQPPSLAETCNSGQDIPALTCE
jgi:hypothetical protein